MTLSAPTPIRGALTEASALLPRVKDGLGAVQTTHKDYLSVELRTAFADSIDIDAALKAGHESENRWDYLLGHAPSGLVVAVEPHSARDDEIAMVINKRAAARAQLKDHLRPGAKIARWLWVASGKVRFASTEKAGFRLAQHGIEFVGSQVQAKHLPAEVAAPAGGTADHTARANQGDHSAEHVRFVGAIVTRAGPRSARGARGAARVAPRPAAAGARRPAGRLCGTLHGLGYRITPHDRTPRVRTLRRLRQPVAEEMRGGGEVDAARSLAASAGLWVF